MKLTLQKKQLKIQFKIHFHTLALLDKMGGTQKKKRYL